MSIILTVTTRGHSVGVFFKNRLSFAIFWFCAFFVLTGCSPGIDRGDRFSVMIVGPGLITIPIIGLAAFRALPPFHPLRPVAIAVALAGAFFSIFYFIHNVVAPIGYLE
jgi:hypothetical protein